MGIKEDAALAARMRGLDQEELNRLLKAAQVEMENRKRSMLRPGAKAKFHARGRSITIMIDKWNHKTVSGMEIDDASGALLKHRTWRVAPSLLTPV